MLFYILAAMVPCAILAIALITADKKITKNSNDLKANISKETLHQIASTPYRPYSGDAKCAVALGVVVDIIEKGDKAKLTVLYFNPPWNEFMTQKRLFQCR